jgi:hypothetical protein
MKVTDPVAADAPVLGGVIEAVTDREFAAVGVRVAGVTITVGALFDTVRVTAVAVEPE